MITLSTASGRNSLDFSSFFMQQGRWYHIVISHTRQRFTFQPSMATLYVDGVEVGFLYYSLDLLFMTCYAGPKCPSFGYMAANGFGSGSNGTGDAHEVYGLIGITKAMRRHSDLCVCCACACCALLCVVCCCVLLCVVVCCV